MAYSDRTYVGTGLGPGAINFNCSRLSSHISCSVKVQHNKMQAINKVVTLKRVSLR